MAAHVAEGERFVLQARITGDRLLALAVYLRQYDDQAAIRVARSLEFNAFLAHWANIARDFEANKARFAEALTVPDWQKRH